MRIPAEVWIFFFYYSANFRSLELIVLSFLLSNEHCPTTEENLSNE